MRLKYVINFLLGSRKLSDSQTTVVEHSGFTNEQSLRKTYSEIYNTKTKNLIINIQQHGNTANDGTPFLQYDNDPTQGIKTTTVLKKCLDNVQSVAVNTVEINLFACKQKFKEDDLINLCKNYQFKIQINYNPKKIYSYRICRRTPDIWCSFGPFKDHASFTHNIDKYNNTRIPNVGDGIPEPVPTALYTPTYLNPTYLEDIKRKPPYIPTSFNPKSYIPTH